MNTTAINTGVNSLSILNKKAISIDRHLRVRALSTCDLLSLEFISSELGCCIKIGNVHELDALLSKPKRVAMLLEELTGIQVNA